MTHNIFFLSIIITSMVFGQDYVWPTDTGKQLTSNFGEFRENHFHMGLDIRTNGSVGHPMYAVNDGYIYRIATNFRGYGKALYLKTIDNKIAVYGHLSKFGTQLENRLFELQNENQSYFVNKYFLPEEYPIKRGEIIGYSGNSGGSMGPHLHFELRDDTDQTLNPMTHGFSPLDHIPPKFLDISIIPLAAGIQINNSPLSQNYIPTFTSSNVYILKDTISVTGKFGVATRVIDKIQNASHSYQIEKLELLVDSLSIFSVQYNMLDFNEGEEILTVVGQPANHPKHNEFQKLYRIESYPKLTIHTDDKTGIINLSDGIHKIEILAWDSAQNKSGLTFYIISIVPPQKQKHATALNLNDYPIFGGNLKVFTSDLIQLEKGAIFQLQTDGISSNTILAFIAKSDTLLTFPLIKTATDKYVSEMINPSMFKDIESCGFLIYSDTTQKYEFDFTPTLILPNSYNKIFSSDNLCSVEINNAVYDTTLMWITKYPKLLKTNSANRKSNVYKIQSSIVPYKNKIDISFSTKNINNLDRSAIYTFNVKKSKWKYVTSNIDTINSIISTKLHEPEIITVLEDIKSPGFIYIYPKNQQTYSKDMLKKFIITLEDDLSGIDPSEENLKVYLDGKRIWVAYQPIKKEISYYLRNLLSRGKHNLVINIQDRSGNSASKTINFFVE